jgi:hypothetical protein
MTVERKSILAAQEREKLESVDVRSEKTSMGAAVEGTISATKHCQAWDICRSLVSYFKRTGAPKKAALSTT